VRYLLILLVRKLVLAAGVAAALATGAGTAGSGHAQAAAAPSARTLAGPAVFYGLSCRGGSFCIAEGSFARPGHSQVPLLEEWNGRRWRILPTPRGYLGATCGGPLFCLAATHLPGSLPRTVMWNGRTWRAFKHQPPDVYDVTCVSPAFCVTFDNVAIRSDLAEWNGKGWHLMPGARNGCGGPFCNFGPLSCATATNCSVSGTYCTDNSCENNVSFSQIWNGSAWIQTAGPVLNAYQAQACAGRGFCMVIKLPALAQVTHDWWKSSHDASSHLAAVCHGIAGCDRAAGLSCGSPWFCVALPSARQSAALAWNSLTWRAVRVARARGRIPELTLLSCGSPRNCAAIGSYRLTPGS
jgi:hypothetical protein